MWTPKSFATSLCFAASAAFLAASASDCVRNDSPNGIQVVVGYQQGFDDVGLRSLLGGIDCLRFGSQ